MNLIPLVPYIRRISQHGAGEHEHKIDGMFASVIFANINATTDTNIRINDTGNDLIFLANDGGKAKFEVPSAGFYLMIHTIQHDGPEDLMILGEVYPPKFQDFITSRK